MSNVAEIASFIRLTRGLSPVTLARAIRRRWPAADQFVIRQALETAEGQHGPGKSTAM